MAALKKRYPDAAIDFLVESPSDEALRGNPHISSIEVYRSQSLVEYLSWIFRIRGKRYDWVIDFMGNPRSAILTAASGALVKAGPAHVGHCWAYNTPLTQSGTTHYAGQEKIRVLKTLDVSGQDGSFLPKLYLDGTAAKPENLIGFVPASRRATRRWPAASYAQLGKLLREKYRCEIKVFWGPGERALAEEVAAGIGGGARISEETRDLQALAGLISRCRLVVTNCNGPKHIAVALGVPTVTIHGSSDPVSWNPASPKHLVVREEQLSCIGCSLNECPIQLQCMTQLSPRKVFESASRLL